MSKRYATVSALIGMAAGAIIASPYLSDATECAADQPAFSCSLNHSVGPFVGAILLGFVLGIAIGRNGQKAWHRWGPSSARLEAEEAVEAVEAEGVPEPATSPPVRVPEDLPATSAEPRVTEMPEREVALGSRGRPRPMPRTRD